MVVRDKGSDSGLVTIYRERESAQSSPRSVTEFYGGIVFFPCTRHVSMYLRPGIVILSVIHSVPRGIIFY